MYFHKRTFDWRGLVGTALTGVLVVRERYGIAAEEAGTGGGAGTDVDSCGRQTIVVGGITRGSLAASIELKDTCESTSGVNVTKNRKMN